MTRNFSAALPARHAVGARPRVAASVVLALAALSTPADAQQYHSPYALPTDTFNSMFRNQLYLDGLGRRMAFNGGMRTYLMMQRYRAITGYTGRFPSFVTPHQQRQASADWNRAAEDYRRSADANSNARLSGADNYANRGIMNQQTMVGPNGGYHYFVPGDYNHVFATPRGRVGTNSETYVPSDGVPLTPLR